MDTHKRLSTNLSSRLKVFAPISLVFAFLVVFVQAFTGFSGGETAVAYAQQNPSPVITPTLTAEEALAAYIESHIIQGDIMPTPTPSPVIEDELLAGPEATSDYAVTLGEDQAGMGRPGEIVTYTLTLSNTGTFSDVYDITAVSDWAVAFPTDVFTLTGETATEVILTVQIPPTADETDTDTAVISAQSRNDAGTDDSVNITTGVALYKVYMPVIYKPLPPAPTPALSATRPNSANDWTMNWSASSYHTGYVLQQSQDPTFMTGVTTLNPSSAATSQLINTNQPSPNHIYYFRIRALGITQDSGWSNTVKVIAAYHDDFSNNQTGWSGPTLKDALRRMTFLETTDTFYENNTWLIFRVKDYNDWAIASPMKPAPQLPYVIEFRSQPASQVSKVSHGVVFGGDWAGAPCPDWSSFDGVYKHQNCFNHFYNANLMWSSSSQMTLLWERIDGLEWCLSCSVRLKRIGDVTSTSINMNASDWNTYRIEVRATDIKFFVNGTLRHTYSDTRWVNDPYFGVFTSTDNLNNSTWRYDYFSITPLDN